MSAGSGAENPIDANGQSFSRLFWALEKENQTCVAAFISEMAGSIT